MSFERRVLVYDRELGDVTADLSARAVSGCWFELHRLGGCGAGEVRLRLHFNERSLVDVGEWVALEYAAGDRWYLGRIDSREAVSPSEVLLRLMGMSVELGEVFPGGFGEGRPGGRPRRYAATDLFGNDPDYAEETADLVASIPELVETLLTEDVLPVSHITLPTEWLDVGAEAGLVTSVKFRGEESVRTILKDLALRAGDVSWGVDAAGEFYFRKQPDDVVLTLQEGVDLTRLEEVRDHQTLYNRLLLTGDYVYDGAEASGQVAQRTYRWRGHYVQPASQAEHGDRRLRIWVPWIRTQADARAFATEFFRRYAQPRNRYRVESLPVGVVLRPWLGRLRLLDAAGEELYASTIETVRVLFDHAPRLVIETGPEDPRVHWPEPEQDERFEIPRNAPLGYGGDVVTFPVSSDDDGTTDGPGGSSSEDEEDSSVWWSGLTSELSSEDLSEESSLESSGLSSGDGSDESGSDGSSSSGEWWPGSTESSGGESSETGSSEASSEEGSSGGVGSSSGSGGGGGWSSNEEEASTMMVESSSEAGSSEGVTSEESVEI